MSAVSVTVAYLAAGNTGTAVEIAAAVKQSTHALRAQLVGLRHEGRAQVVAHVMQPRLRSGIREVQAWGAGPALTACGPAETVGPRVEAVPLVKRALASRTPLEQAWRALTC